MKYFAMIDGEQKGPFELAELAQAGVRPGTYVWCKGMADWEKAEDVADICRFYRNRIYDLMHPGSVEAERRIEERRIEDAHIPSLEEIDNMHNNDVPPYNILPLAIIATILFFPPTGAVAIYYGYKAKKDWKAGLHAEAHENSRSAKMWTGITFCLGIIFYALLFRV